MSSRSSPRSSLLIAASLAIFFLTAAWFYSWAPATYPVRWTSQNGDGHYSELTDAFLHGHLYLSRKPDSGLLALTNPYDPAKNAAYRANDLSFYKGHYYLYHGAAPVLTLLAPFRLLTGRHLTNPAATLIFCLAGAAFSLLLLGNIWRKATPRASRTIFVVSAFAVLFCHGYYLVLRDSGTNQVAIASAYCFLILAIWGAYRALTSLHRSWPWLLGAVTAYGLAIASRPNYVFGTIALLVPVMAIWRRHGMGWSKFKLVSLATPLFVIIGGMLAQNYFRFDHPLEFGQRYMLGAWDQRELDFFGLKGLAVNAWQYLAAPGNLSSEFPFMSAPDWQAVGVLVQTPFTWLGLSIFILWLRHVEPRLADSLRPLTKMVALIIFCNLGLLLFLPSGNEQAVLTSANARYTFDFLPALVLLTCFGALGLDHLLADRRWLKRGWRASALALVFTSLLSALSLDFSRIPAESHRSLTQVLNWPTHFVSHWLGTTYGPVNLEIIFPANRPHGYEPIVATGKRGAADLLYVFYESPTTVRFGLVGTSMKGPLSPPIPVTYGQPYRLDIQMGSLYPSAGNPLLSDISDAEVARLKRTLRIDLDGVTVYEIPAHFFPSRSRDVQIGSTKHLKDYCVAEFSGQILSTSRLSVTPPTAIADQAMQEYGALKLVLRFPTGKTGATEPLVVSGVQNAGDFIFVRYESKGQIRLGFDHWGHMGFLSDLLPIDFSVNHILEIQMGALFPPAGHVLLSELNTNQIEQLKTRVRLVLDGAVVMDIDQPSFESSPYDVFIGRNAIGGSTCVYEFSGDIKSVSRLSLPATIH